MPRRKKEKKETYYQRWLKGKKRMLIIMKEEEFNAIKQFCDANMMSYREYFTQVAPKLLLENQELKKKIDELTTQVSAKENEVAQIKSEYYELVQNYNALLERYKGKEKELGSVKSRAQELESENAKLREELSKATNEIASLKQKISDLEAQLRDTSSELVNVKKVLDTIIKEGYVELNEGLCPQMKAYGFKLVQKEVSTGFMKKVTVTVCANRKEPDYI